MFKDKPIENKPYSPWNGTGIPYEINGKPRKYEMWSEEDADILRKCDEYLYWFSQHPPRLTGWLKGGIDLERMLRLKAEIEGTA